MRTGIAHLPLHTGHAPRWLFELMVRLAREVVAHLVAEYGATEVVRRLADPFWFQALGCLLGFDWHSSGLTTTTCGALKEAVKGREWDFGVVVAGGKGGTSRKTPQEIVQACEGLARDPDPLVYTSRMVAKVDSAAVQDGYELYHHCFVFTPDGSWCVIQQGMSEETRMARRYHWCSEQISNLVCEPHTAICCDAQGPTLNLVARESQPAQEAMTELAREPHQEFQRLLKTLPTLTLPDRHEIEPVDIDATYLKKILLRTYEAAPPDFEHLLAVPGVGPKTLRALTLAAELIYGIPASTRDPARFAFAHGGKDRIPYPVDRVTYEQTIDVLQRALDRATLPYSEKTRALKRLLNFTTSP
ncbi:MAG: DUF763 domain-containing protein [Nitrospirae bacterium]|nr:MAG: DUF763 domain-containing protein [Nitrospirota bacterium]